MQLPTSDHRSPISGSYGLWAYCSFRPLTTDLRSLAVMVFGILQSPISDHRSPISGSYGLWAYCSFRPLIADLRSLGVHGNNSHVYQVDTGSWCLLYAAAFRSRFSLEAPFHPRKGASKSRKRPIFGANILILGDSSWSDPQTPGVRSHWRSSCPHTRGLSGGIFTGPLV